MWGDWGGPWEKWWWWWCEGWWFVHWHYLGLLMCTILYAGEKEKAASHSKKGTEDKDSSSGRSKLQCYNIETDLVKNLTRMMMRKRRLRRRKEGRKRRPASQISLIMLLFFQSILPHVSPLVQDWRKAMMVVAKKMYSNSQHVQYEWR